MNQDPKLFVALDSIDLTITLIQARALATVKGNFGFKINLHTIIAERLQPLMQVLQELGKPIFADIKMMADYLTMLKVLVGLCQAGVDYVSVSLLTEPETLKTLADLIKNEKTELLGWTVPSWWSDETCFKEHGRNIKDQVWHLASKAEAHCYGVILPPLYFHFCPDWVRQIGGENRKLMKIAPGIRELDLPGANDDHHQNPLSIRQAFKADADAIVVGTPITGNDNIIQNLKLVLEKINLATG